MSSAGPADEVPPALPAKDGEGGKRKREVCWSLRSVDHTVRSIISGREVLHLLPLSFSFKNAPSPSSLLHLVFWAVKTSQQVLWMWMAPSVAVCAPFETLPFARHLHLSISIHARTQMRCVSQERDRIGLTLEFTAIWRCAACILLRPFMSMIGREDEKKESEHSRPRLCFTCFLTLAIATHRFFSQKSPSVHCDLTCPWIGRVEPSVLQSPYLSMELAV